MRVRIVDAEELKENKSDLRASNYVDKKPINAANLDRFCEVFASVLREARKKYPSSYAWPLNELPAIVGRMRGALRTGSYSHEGYAFRTSCKRLAIKPTRKAMDAFLREDSSPPPRRAS